MYHTMHGFQTLGRSRRTVHATLITTYGLRENVRADMFQSVVTARVLLSFLGL